MDRQFKFYTDLIINDLKTALTDINIAESSSLWDLVVITAINQKQRLCYEKQLERKLKNKKLPSVFRYIVLNDPDQCKIGSGGSTLNVINFLYEKYQEKLYDLKILIIHAGGYSQRIPNNTVLGKIFSPMPCDSTYINDFLDIKLAILTPFSISMKPGIFVTSSDAIVSCDIDEQIEAGSTFGAFDNDFALLSHKSSLTVGKDHGIYAIEPSSNESKSNNLKCKYVLQKPSIEQMHEKKVVLFDEEIKEYVYSDSEIYFSHRITKILKKFHGKYFEQIASEKIEIDAWRDFLQPLGTNPISLEDYLLSAKSKIQMFVELYEHLFAKETSVVSLFDSHFFHLGTTNELLEFYLDKNLPDSLRFRNSICFTNQKFNTNNISCLDNLKGCIFYSKLNDHCKLATQSLVEFTYIDEDICLHLGDFSYLNNCMLNVAEMPKLKGAQIEVPNNVFMHTISIKTSDIVQYVTIFFNRKDDVKKIYNDLKSLIFLGKFLPSKFIKAVHNTEKNCIWSLKIFTPAKTMSESFVQSLQFIKSYLIDDDSTNFFKENQTAYSLFDLLEINDCEDMIAFRERNCF